MNDDDDDDDDGDGDGDGDDDGDDDDDCDGDDDGDKDSVPANHGMFAQVMDIMKGGKEPEPLPSPSLPHLLGKMIFFFLLVTFFIGLNHYNLIFNLSLLQFLQAFERA